MEAVGILSIIFVFIIVISAMGQSYSLKKAKIKYGDKEKNTKQDEADVSRQELIRELDKLEKRIDNMDIIMKDRKQNGN
ncbi:MAG: hypothetical protein WC162_00245 [Sphaerochaetaceae bacterium]